MKNPTILKDELSLLRSDKSAVITELRNKSKEIKEIGIQISKLESKLEDVKTEIINETARLDDIRGRAVSVKGELSVVTQDLKNTEKALDISKTSNSQEIKLHLGRIKELEEKEKEVTDSISNLKKLFDNNSKVYNKHESERQSKLRNLDTKIKEKNSELTELEKEFKKKQEEDKKITKERLKREDKVRHRERMSDAKEISLLKWEEDLTNMSKDMTIVYMRMKELYAKVSPDVDLDKLILQAI